MPGGRNGQPGRRINVEFCTLRIRTSANNTVTCLYSAGVAAGVMGAPHLLQNFEFSGGSSVPHDPHPKPVAVMSSP